MKPICVPCRRFFRPDKNGVAFLEGMPVENGAPRGNAAPEKWEPYKLWQGDRWKCPGCGALVIVGVGFERIAEHFEPGFADKVRDHGATLQINDC